MNKIFLFFVLLLMPSLALAVPVSYYGNIIYEGDISTGHTLEALSHTGVTTKTIYQSQFLLNHLENKGGKILFYFDGSYLMTYTQPLPGSVVNLGNVAIGNSPPTAPKIDVTPNAAYTANDLTCGITEQSTDAEGDTISYTYKWYKNGVLDSTTSGTLSYSKTSKGELWNCTVIPSDSKTHSDGTIYGPSGSDIVKILNSVPSITSPIPSNTKQTIAEGNSLTFSISGSDADGSVTYSWELDGNSVESNTNSYTYTSTSTSAGTHSLTVTVSDGELSKTQSWAIVVINVNLAPTLTVDSTKSCSEGSPCALTATASDSDSDDILTFYDNTTLFSIGSSTGVISFTPSQSNVGVHHVKLTVSDGKGKFESKIVVFTISNVNDAPVLNSIGTQTAIQGTEFSYKVIATDRDGNVLRYSLTTSPTGMTINPATGLINWTPDSTGTNPVTVLVTEELTDEEETGTESFSLVVVSGANNHPTIDSFTPTTNPTIAEPDSQTFTITSSDPDGGTPSIRWFLNSKALDETSSTYTFSGSHTTAGIYSVKAQISDGQYTAEKTWALTVTDTNRAPVLTASSTQTCTEDAACPITISASDADSDNKMVYSDNTSLFKIGLLTGTVSFVPTQANVGAHSILFRAADGTTSDTKTMVLTISNAPDAPILARIGSRTLLEGNSYSLKASAADEDGDTLTYSLTNPPSGMAVGPSTGIITWTPSFQDSGSYLVLVKVTDDSDSALTDSEEVAFTVVNQNQAPTITATTPPQYIRIGEENSTTFTIDATDPDGAGLTTAWYKDAALLEDEMFESYTFYGNFSDEGTNAGAHSIKAVVTDGMANASYTWTLNVTRTRDADKDNVPDYRDNCKLVYNPGQDDLDANDIGDACQGNIDGDDVDDSEDFVMGDADNVETNVENMDLSIGGSDNLNQVINETQPINLTETTYDEITGQATTVPVLEFNYDFTPNSTLDLGNLTVKKQTGNTTGSIIISGIDLTSQGETKTVYLDSLAGEDYICVKDVEIASITELPSSSCTGTNEIAVPCSATGSTASGYTCTIAGSKLKVEGLTHSGVSESTYTPPSEDGGNGGGDTGPTGPGGGGGIYIPRVEEVVEEEEEVVEEEVIEEEEESPPIIRKIEPAEPTPTAPTGGLGAITGMVISALSKPGVGQTIVAIFIIAAIGLTIYITIFHEGGSHFIVQNSYDRCYNKAAMLHRKAEGIYREGKQEKANALYKKAQTYRERGERLQK